MRTVPRVQRKHLVESLASRFGVDELAGEVRGRHRAQHCNPALVHCLEELQRRFDRYRLHIGELSLQLRCLQDCVQSHPIFKKDLGRLKKIRCECDWIEDLLKARTPHAIR